MIQRSFYFVLSAFLLLASACTESVSNACHEQELPDIFPDYVEVTIPSNIAPLNFCMSDESALLVDALISDDKGHQLHGQGKETTDFDIDDWHQLLADNVEDFCGSFALDGDDTVVVNRSYVFVR